MSGRKKSTSHGDAADNAPRERPAAYKVLRKVRHNGVEYNPAPGTYHLRAKRLKNGVTLLDKRDVAGFPDKNAPSAIPASELTEQQVRDLIRAKAIQDPDAEEITPEEEFEEKAARDANQDPEGRVIPGGA